MPIPGATVNFTSNSIYSTITPSSVISNGNGNAAALLSSSATGSVLVTASFANVLATNTITFTSAVNVTFLLAAQTSGLLCTPQERRPCDPDA